MTTIPQDVQGRIDQHLDAIDAALAATGMNRGERSAIVDDVQGQISEILALRVKGEATASDVQAVIAELDPPEAYGELDPSSAKPPVDVSITAQTRKKKDMVPMIVACAVASLLIVLIVSRGATPALVPIALVAIFIWAVLKLVRHFCRTR
jgi:hypothetical protein